MKKKKWVTGLLCLTLAGSLVACAGNSTNNTNTTPAPSAPTNSNEQPAVETPAAPANISIMISDHSQPVPGGNSMDNPTIKYMAEQTNTNLDVTFLPHGDYQNQLQVKYASGEVPAVIQSWGIETKLIENDMLLPLNDLIDEHGPNLKANIPQEAWDAVTIDGQIYGIPQTSTGNAKSGRVIYVRKDWMENAGVTEIPATPDEFLDMLRAFRDNDPNQNGRQDEIPFTARDNFSWMDNIFGMFGANEHNDLIIDGQLVPGYVTPQFKKAVDYINTMYEEGLIDSEFMSNARNVWEQKIQSNTAGSWNHVTELAWDWQERLNTSLPDINPEVIAIPTPRDPEWDGPVGMIQTPVIKVFNVTNKTEDPAAVIRFFDYLASEEGQAFVKLGIPGVTHTQEGGVYTYDAEKDQADQTAAWRETLFGIVSYNKDLLQAQLNNEAAVAALDASFAIGAAEGLENYRIGAPAFETSRIYPDHRKDGTMWREAAAKIILGDAPIDSYDDFIAEWKATGGTEMIEEHTAWFNNR